MRQIVLSECIRMPFTDASAFVRQTSVLTGTTKNMYIDWFNPLNPLVSYGNLSSSVAVVFLVKFQHLHVRFLRGAYLRKMHCT